jgi:cytochrome c556
MKRVLVLFSCAFLLAEGVSFAHEGEAHGKHQADAQMVKLHKMMPKYAKSQALINAALEKGDVATIAKETKYLLSTVADLKKAKPHKQLKELKEFQTIAENFEKDVKSTAELARKGDVEGAKASFSSAQKGCSACHVKFRD